LKYRFIFVALKSKEVSSTSNLFEYDFSTGDASICVKSILLLKKLLIASTSFV